MHLRTCSLRGPEWGPAGVYVCLHVKDRLIDKCDPLAKFLYPCFTPFSPVISLTKLIMSVPAQNGIQYMPILLGQRILIVPLIVGPLTIGIG